LTPVVPPPKPALFSLFNSTDIIVLSFFLLKYIKT
jgi:hypothetical protein